MFANEGPTGLFDPSVTPRTGTPTTTISFRVMYRNHEGSSPDHVSVVVDGTAHVMAAGGTSGWKRGVPYTWSTRLAVGSHAVSFEAIERNRFVSTADGGTVTIALPATPPPTATPKPTPKPTPPPTATPKPTPKPTPRPTPTPAPTATPRATPAPSASHAPTPTPSPSSSSAGSATGGTGSGGGDGAGPSVAPGSGDSGTGVGPTDPPTGGAGTGSGGSGTGGSGPDSTGGSAGGGVGADWSNGSGDGSGRSTVTIGANGVGLAGSGLVDDGGTPPTGDPAAIAGDPTAGGGAAARDPLTGGPAWGALASALAVLGIDRAPQITMLPMLVGTSTAMTMAFAFAIFGKKRRDEQPPAPDEVLQAEAARGHGAVPGSEIVNGVVRAAAIPAPIDIEAGMPRWRRPSLLEARKADPTRSVASSHRMSFEDGLVGPVDGRERRIIRYAVVRLLDAPDELRSAEIGQLDQGDEVQLLERSGSYWLVLCPDGRQGWLHKMTLGEIVSDAAPSREVDDDVLTAFLTARAQA